VATRSEKENLLVVCGPNASGKTALGVQLAARYGGEILSADSRQVYRGMDIGTGKDFAEYRTASATIPHHLIDLADPQEIYTLYHYMNDFYAAFREVTGRGRLPIMVGGSGLYIEAVLKQYRVPNVPEDVGFRDRYMKKDRNELLRLLADAGPSLGMEIDLSSKKRIVRALEIAEYAKARTVRWGGENPPPIRAFVLCVRMPREELIRRIDSRLDQRLKAGMVDEARRLLDAGISRDRMMLFGLEYKYLTRYLLKEIGYDEMVNRLSTAIHQFAKRQMTWFRGMERRGIAIHWIEGVDLNQARALVDGAFRRSRD
jgi:tRNA dimethylallyltransferase